LLDVAVTNWQESAACTQVLKRDKLPDCAGYKSVCTASQIVAKEMAGYFSAPSWKVFVSETHCFCIREMRCSTLGCDTPYSVWCILWFSLFYTGYVKAGRGKFHRIVHGILQRV